MKKWLSILGVIGLTATSTTSLISCQKPNNNENGGDNKPKPPYNPQQPQEPEKPPEGSNWKLIPSWQDKISNWKEENNKKTYIGIIKIETGWTVIKWIGENLDYKYQYKSIYRWDSKNEPKTPEIDTNTGKISDWKE